MKRLIFILFVALFSACQSTEKSESKITLLERDGWMIQQTSDGVVWYNYTGYYPAYESNQVVNILQVDLKKNKLELAFCEEMDSLSSFAQQRAGVIAGMNGGYFDEGTTFVRSQDTIRKEVTIDSTALRFWKHEGALYFDDNKIEIKYGDNQIYKDSEYDNVLSGSPMLIDNFKGVGNSFVPEELTLEDIKTYEPEHYINHQGVRHPRSAIAVLDPTTVLLITVDGRSATAKGMSARELTTFLQRYFNPAYALNLDGGGSTSMYIKDHGVHMTDIVNFPSDNKKYGRYKQRKMDNAILVKQK